MSTNSLAKMDGTKTSLGGYFGGKDIPLPTTLRKWAGGDHENFCGRYYSKSLSE